MKRCTPIVLVALVLSSCCIGSGRREGQRVHQQEAVSIRAPAGSAGSALQTRNLPVWPGATIPEGVAYTGFETSYHIHPYEDVQPCLILRSKNDEIHAFIRQEEGQWTASVVRVIKGDCSPVPGVKIGDSLGALKRALPEGKMMRVQSEITDPVVFRAALGQITMDVTVDWEESWRQQGGNWDTFKPESVPNSARILVFTLY